MPTVVTDDDEALWTWSKPIPNLARPTIRQLLAGALDPKADFYVYEGSPYLVFGQRVHVEDCSVHPIRFAHSVAPIFNGTRITESQFRQIVRAMHAIESHPDGRTSPFGPT